MRILEFLVLYWKTLQHMVKNSHRRTSKLYFTNQKKIFSLQKYKLSY